MYCIEMRDAAELFGARPPPAAPLVPGLTIILNCWQCLGWHHSVSIVVPVSLVIGIPIVNNSRAPINSGTSPSISLLSRGQPVPPTFPSSRPPVNSVISPSSSPLSHRQSVPLLIDLLLSFHVLITSILVKVLPPIPSKVFGVGLDIEASPSDLLSPL